MYKFIFPPQIDFATLLYQEALMYQSYNLETLMTKQQPESCPYFVEPLKPKLEYEKSNPIVVPDNEIYTRKPLIPLGKFYPTYLIWVDDISSILKVFDATVLKCDQKIDRGIYNRQSKFIFVMNQNEKNLEKVFTKSEYLKKHQNVAIIQSLPFGVDQKFKVYGNNIATEKDIEITINHLWSTSNPFKDIEDVFAPKSNSKGKVLLGANNK